MDILTVNYGGWPGPSSGYVSNALEEHEGQQGSFDLPSSEKLLLLLIFTYCLVSRLLIQHLFHCITLRLDRRQPKDEHLVLMLGTIVQPLNIGISSSVA